MSRLFKLALGALAAASLAGPRAAAYSFSFFGGDICAGGGSFGASGLPDGACLVLPSDRARRGYHGSCADRTFTFCSDAACSRGCHTVPFGDGGCAVTSGLPASVVPAGVAAVAGHCEMRS